ncbi:HAMP domain-containing histidine kinase [Duganella sp. FT3S]|uniref:histidine kinase n=1 Tax=Rugamonas fusca TaxID=2758568 RepID=A0A7W2EJY1_9BURK|nr:HAMP domain-containing sensor histidine kinase [Rugamonas fusca]MBA5607182.1 HAMP domain-containing histidine kinase [Rugamonas fusca]
MMHKEAPIEPPIGAGAPARSTTELTDWQTFRQLEVRQLRRTIGDLLHMTEKHNALKERHDTYAKLVPRLQAANEQLVLAIFGARDMQQAAEAVNRQQMEFFAMLAHELRNPLHPIIMANHLIGELAGHRPDLTILHDIIERQVALLVRLVDDLMDASRVRMDKITIARSRLSLRDAIQGAVEIGQPLLTERGQQLSLDLPAEPLCVDGDLDRLTQALSNLLLNASKFTPQHGHIAIRARAEGSNAVVTVSDDGAGIAPELQPQIFDLFTQGPRPLHRALGGLGIGLSLVRRIAELHGGSVRVYSEGSGKGSAFSVYLPLAPPPAVAAAPLAASATSDACWQLPRAAGLLPTPLREQSRPA